MSTSTSATSTSAPESMPVETKSPPVVLRGTGRGLELLVAERATLDEIVEALQARLEAAPGFFTGSDVTVRLNGARLPVGALTRLEAVTARFGLRIAEVRSGALVASTPAAPVAATKAPATPAMDPPGTARLHVGPVRSGVVLEVPGDLVVLGDVNPGAEVRAGGNITVMGALRGVAHAGHGGSTGFIVALRLDPQQIRIGTLIARAGDPAGGARGAEIAFAPNGQIVVESYQGRLPSGALPARR
jgi:septum site-determining protein MinC